MSGQADGINELGQRGLGIHLVMDAAHPNAFTWATVELAMALDRLGVAVSIPRAAIHPSIPPHKADRLTRWMKEQPERDVHIKWSHFWPHHLEAPLFGTVNAEIICTNYRYRANAAHHDLWTRHIRLNGYRKVPVSTFNQSALGDIGFAAAECPVIPLGYSPEIRTLFPEGRVASAQAGRPLNILLVTNSNDLYRYGTDLALKALDAAFGDLRAAVLHIKDYGAGAGSSRLESWVRQYPALPVVWHNEFVEKEELLKLYASMDLLLAPFRGEGFSMKILDAMAIGVPVMMPAFGGPADFAFDGAFLPVSFREVPVGECFDRQSYPLGDEIYWCEPDADDLARQLVSAAENREQLTEVGRRARSGVLDAFSWERAAETWVRVLRGLLQERDASRASFAPSSSGLLSVLMPTKNRVEVLERTLRAFSRQTLSRAAYELVIVNDGGAYDSLQALCSAFADLPIRLLNNDGLPGRSPARNLAVRQARGEVVLFIGDDIVPCDHFLETHQAAHRQAPEKTAAFLGYTDWHSDLSVSAFERMLSGPGGHQFDYSRCTDGSLLTYHQFYTCNISLKRSFLTEQELLFDPVFPYGFEDIELAYRLHLQGLTLRFLERARGYHYHPTSPEAYLRRQYHIGEDLLLWILKQPSTDTGRTLMPMLLSLERQRLAQWRGLENGIAPEALNSELLRLYNALLHWVSNAETTQAPGSAQELEWFQQTHRGVWECMNELALRTGMARAWAASQDDRDQAVAWLTLLCLPRVVGPTNFYDRLLAVPPTAQPADSGAVLFRNSPFLFHFSHALRTCPLLGRLVCAVEASAPVQRLKTRLSR